jgi:RluA family pseudouridine synthase
MSQPIPILYEDAGLLIVDKPAGLLSVPSLADALREQGVEAQPVHRLDRDVSGCVLLARAPAMRKQLEELFRERSISKTYWALVCGSPRKDEASIQYPILHEKTHARVSARGQRAHTRYRVLRRLRYKNTDVTEIEIDLITGRYNQIRIHFAHDKLPLIGERKYARGSEDPLKSPRLALHAWRLAFVHPSEGRQIETEAPLPDDLLKLVQGCSSR